MIYLNIWLTNHEVNTSILNIINHGFQSINFIKLDPQVILLTSHQFFCHIIPFAPHH